MCKYGLSAHVMHFLKGHGGKSGHFAPWMKVILSVGILRLVVPLLAQIPTLCGTFASSTYLLPQRGQNRLFCLRRWFHVCKYGLSAHFMQFLKGHGGTSGIFAPVVLHRYCPELRPELQQKPAQLRVFLNLPRAMPLFGAPHRPIAFSSHKSLRKRLRGYVLTGLLLFGKTEQPEIHAAGESVDSLLVS